MSTELTQARLKELLHYDPETGVFTWVAPTSWRVRAGTVAGYLARGYRYIRVDGVRHGAHRLAVLYMLGHMPVAEVDHRNGVPSDNSWLNLRECTHAENHQNRGRHTARSNAATAQSGVPGVTWHKLRCKWRASVTSGGKQHHCGLFDTVAEAHQAYLTAKARLHTFQPTPRTS